MDDAKIIIMCILRVNGHKRVGLTNIVSTEQNELGFFNEKN